MSMTRSIVSIVHLTSLTTCKDTGYSGADGCQTNRERGVTTTTYSTLLVYLQIRTSIYRIYTQ